MACQPERVFRDCASTAEAVESPFFLFLGCVTVPVGCLYKAQRAITKRTPNCTDESSLLFCRENRLGDGYFLLIAALYAASKFMSSDFQLYEALLWQPAEGYFLLDYHLRRLQRSAAHFHFRLDPDAVRDRLLNYAEQLPRQPRKVRLEVEPSGLISMNDLEVKPSTPVSVAIAREPVDSKDEFLRHKTSRRACFDRALAAHPEAQDVLLWNERRELTETCHGNVVLEMGGRKLTPPLSSGLLPGVFRAYLLDTGEIREEVLTLDSLGDATSMFLINSVRKWCPMRPFRH